MTNQQIVEKSNLPESTVARIFSGKTPNPTIATAVSMARAMGGSAADFMNEDDQATEERPSLAPADQDDGMSSAPENADAPLSDHAKSVASAPFPPPPEGNSASDKYYEDIILFYKNTIKKKDEWIARLFWCLAGIMLFILFILIFDILHPNLGYVKY